uniref:Uncharacterized protein n=1 Tax=Anguilla anguilla TaxID=7936 RepID=A0A0E9Q541_ANGAN
MTALLFAELS